MLLSSWIRGTYSEFRFHFTWCGRRSQLLKTHQDWIQRITPSLELLGNKMAWHNMTWHGMAYEGMLRCVIHRHIFKLYRYRASFISSSKLPLMAVGTFLNTMFVFPDKEINISEAIQPWNHLINMMGKSHAGKNARFIWRGSVPVLLSCWCYLGCHMWNVALVKTMIQCITAMQSFKSTWHH